MSDTANDPRVQHGIFPIWDHEAAVLHDLGWQSGYGWSNEWDWWHSDTPEDQQMDSRDWDSTKLRLHAHLTAIRQARREADSILVRHFRTVHRTPAPSFNPG